ncbi:MAG: hypothetical protein IPK07_22495 [Deltaproteobacteria bacterium]|nr:hypothetical protein [Deltaproteobacteria bacterium]
MNESRASTATPQRSGQVRPAALRRALGVAVTLGLASGCSYQNPLSDAGKAFRSGSASWGTYALAQTYAATLRESRQDCFISLFDVDVIAGKAYEVVDPTTRSETLRLIDSIYQDQRRQLATTYPGAVVFQTDSGQEQVVIPPVHRAFRSPLEECPNRPAQVGRTILEGDVEGTLRIEFPYRGKVLEMRARLSERGGRVTSIPVLREVQGTVFEAPAPPPPAPPPPPVTAPVSPQTSIEGQPLQ